ncbi:MAG: DUF4236 domain-containing protein [Lachnospiraceae bacterium]|jgi:hypothetical protein|nr:DUF4236 domain-containing protein [Lachnospiraceae bacterium]
MGLRYRKSRNLGGGFRINISKAGIGYSWGIPGYRITRTASGKTRRTASIPGTGISYVTEDSGKSKITNKTAQEKDFLVTEIKNVDSGNIAELQPAEFTDLTNKLQRIITMNTISTCLIWGTIILCIGYQSIWRILLVLAAIIFKVAIYTICHIQLDYSFDDGSDQCITAKRKIDAWEILKGCKQIWYIDTVGKTASARNSGGATSALNRIPTQIGFVLPYYLRSNINLPVIPMNKAKETLIILPDSILLVKKNKVGAVKYTDINIDIYAIGEICTKAPAYDCKYSKNVWLYANKDGSPDMRHKDNKQLPVYEIGRIDISSPNGLDIRLAFSNTDVLEKFKTAYQ